MGRRGDGPVRGSKVRRSGPKVEVRTTGPSHWTLAPSPRRPLTAVSPYVYRIPACSGERIAWRSIDSQQPFAREARAVHHARRGSRRQRSNRAARGNAAGRRPDTCRGNSRTDRAELQLQDELADQTLFVRRMIGAIERDLVASNGGGVVSHVSKFCTWTPFMWPNDATAESHHVRPLPQAIGVDEAGAGRILDGGVGTANGVAVRLQRLERFSTQRRFVAQSQPAAQTVQCLSAGCC